MNQDNERLFHIGITKTPYHTPLNKSVTICGLTAREYYHEKFKSGRFRNQKKHGITQGQFITCNKCIKSIKRKK